LTYHSISLYLECSSVLYEKNSNAYYIIARPRRGKRWKTAQLNCITAKEEEGRGERDILLYKNIVFKIL
jgi:hypothetical protein